MRFMLLIYWDEREDAVMTQEEIEAQYGAYRQFTAKIREDGRFLFGDALQPTATARKVQVRGTRTLHTDGPFTETKEHLGGIYVVNCDTLEEAAELAAQIPHAQSGTVIIRPILEY